MYLLDTNVVSELRRAKAGKADPRVVAWGESMPVASLFLSVITLLELEMGVLLIERRDPAQGAILRAWLDSQVLPAFAGRILAIDTAVARRCARLHVPDPRSGSRCPHCRYSAGAWFDGGDTERGRFRAHGRGPAEPVDLRDTSTNVAK